MSAGTQPSGASAYEFRVTGRHVDPTPMPNDVPSVPEVGLTSAPLTSASYYLGSYCKKYNEDFMLCKNENNDPAHCLKEGRRVTRCSIDFFTKLAENCGKEFEGHWNCLDNNNLEFRFCRNQERKFADCVLKSMPTGSYL